MDFLDFIGSIDTLQALLLVLGIIFLVIEVFIPGFGVAGIIGGILVIVGIFLTANTVIEVILLLIIIILIVGVAVMFALSSASKGRFSKTVVLQDSLSKESGFSSTEDMTYFLNKKGRSLTTLRPSGIAEFEGVKLDVVTQGEYIAAERDIEVMKVVGSRIIVREIK